MDTDAIAEFWQRCRAEVADLPDLPDPPALPEEPPAAWAFGATPDHADGLLSLVVAGTKTATASSLWDYEHAGDALPQVGELSIILDGSGAPRALIQTTDVVVVPFGEVTAAHAFAEGERDRTLASWREIHERYWTEHSEGPRGYEPDMPVVCESFRLLVGGTGPS